MTSKNTKEYYTKENHPSSSVVSFEDDANNDDDDDNNNNQEMNNVNNSSMKRVRSASFSDILNSPHSSVTTRSKSATITEKRDLEKNKRSVSFGDENDVHIQDLFTPFHLATTTSFDHTDGGGGGRNRRSTLHSIVDVHPTMERFRVTSGGGEEQHPPPAPTIQQQLHPPTTTATMEKHSDKYEKQDKRKLQKGGKLLIQQKLENGIKQIPAVALLGLFHLMVGIPFGVSYFPVEWRVGADAAGGGGDESMGDVGDGENAKFHGPFPLPGKESLGIRMFLFSTLIGQIVFTFASNFNNAIGLQMVENVPFCHALTFIVIEHQGYGIEALSTLFFLFGFSSVVVGVVFYLLGKFQLGRVVYFFPSHVLLGLIGGIGIFIAKTGLEVTTDATLTFTSLVSFFVDYVDLLGVVFGFEVVLRLLTRLTQHEDGSPRYPLLSPIYFCMITPVFYLGMWLFRRDLEEAKEAGYFFPSLDDCTTEDCEDETLSVWESIFDEHMWDMWRVIDFSTISWSAVYHSIPTLVALALFSLIHVPINIPAFAISTRVDVDMDKELVAHGYSNALAGIVGGLQNYMAYTQSVLYARSGGVGKASSLAVATVTGALFVIGPFIASYIPRCMAGTLLFHVGIDLFLEGVYDTIGKFDILEYGGIWLITVVMTFLGMEAALIAGAISALSVYAFQSITYLNPIRGSMSAVTLRSSAWNRCALANAILNDEDVGRKRILVVQLQGHLFFGNVAQLTDSIKKIISEKQRTNEDPWIMIMDFSLILGMDSSAAQAIIKLKSNLHKKFHVAVCLFVTGSSDGFPCQLNLSKELIAEEDSSDDEKVGTEQPVSSECVEDGVLVNETTALLGKPGHMMRNNVKHQFPENFVCESLDSALIIAEDVLVGMKDPNLLDENMRSSRNGSIHGERSLSDEKEMAIRYLRNICPQRVQEDIEELFSHFRREVYVKSDVIWKQGSPGDCSKLLLQGTLLSLLENEAGTTESIKRGNLIGEFGLVQGTNRMSSVKCVSDEAILYSLSRDSWEQLTREKPRVAQIMYLIVVQYLAHRVQHVSNRIFETRCVPI